MEKSNPKSKSSRIRSELISHKTQKASLYKKKNLNHFKKEKESKL